MRAVPILGDTSKEVVLHAKSQTIHSPAEIKSKNQEKQKSQAIIYIMVSRQNLHSSLPKITNLKLTRK